MLLGELQRGSRQEEQRNEDLEKFHDLVVGRELKMMELERQVRTLKDHDIRDPT